MEPKSIVPLLLAWFNRNARDLPWRRTRDPYAIWISESMLQQTQVKTVLPFWRRWMEALPTVQDLAKASPQRIHKLWEGLGYYARVRNLHRAAQLIVEKHQGKFPKAFEEVLELPGVGRYTAGAICSIAFNQPKPVLDGNVIRVLARVFGIDGDPKSKQVNASLWQLSEQLVQHAAAPYSSDAKTHLAPRRTPQPLRLRERRRVRYPASSFNQALMELGALLCTPRGPRCAACPVSSLCVAFQSDRVDDLPRLKPRPTITNRHFIAFVAQRGNRFLVRQRPAGVLNAHLWEFPNLEVVNGTMDVKGAARQELGTRPRKLEPLCSLRHSITRYRITIDVFRVDSERIKPKIAKSRWADRSGLLRLPFSSAHRKIAARVLAADRKASLDHAD
jgi:A/G-specific adenine glycosylase